MSLYWAAYIGRWRPYIGRGLSALGEGMTVLLSGSLSIVVPVSVNKYSFYDLCISLYTSQTPANTVHPGIRAVWNQWEAVHGPQCVDGWRRERLRLSALALPVPGELSLACRIASHITLEIR